MKVKLKKVADMREVSLDYIWKKIWFCGKLITRLLKY